MASNEKIVKARVQLKADSYTAWDKAENSFKPLKNELIIYLPEEDVNTSYKFKLGDGDSYINQLDFIESKPVWHEF